MHVVVRLLVFFRPIRSLSLCRNLVIVVALPPYEKVCHGVDGERRCHVDNDQREHHKESVLGGRIELQAKRGDACGD